MKNKFKNTKSVNKLLVSATGIGLALVLGACGTESYKNETTIESVVVESNDSGHDIVSETSEEIITQTETTVIETPQNSSEDEYFTDKDLNGDYDELKSIRITLSKNSVMTNDSENTDVMNSIEVNDNSVIIKEEGTYILDGEYEGSIIVDADSTAKMQLVLDGVKIENTDSAAIYVKQADKVFVTLADNSVNSFSVIDTFADTDEGIDAVIFSKDDIVINGNGKLEIISSGHGIVSKDDLKITGGDITITADSSGINTNDSIRLTSVSLNITSGTDAVHADNQEDSELGYIYIKDGSYTIRASGDGFSASKTIIIEGGDFDIQSGGGSTGVSTMNTSGNMMNINASSSADDESTKGIKADNNITINNGKIMIESGDDGIHSNNDTQINNGDVEITSNDDAIHADGKVEINNGNISIIAPEGIEGNYVQINDGTIKIQATDDGINAGNKSGKYEVAIEINGGDIQIDMGQGDTDAIDSNGNLYVNGGTINITGQSSFDYDGYAEYTGGTIIVNGQEVNSIQNQFMGGGNWRR